MTNLKEHSKSHVDDFYTDPIVYSLIIKSRDIITSSKHHTPDILEEIENFVPTDTCLNNITQYLNSVKMKNIELLYNRLFQDVMVNSKRFFPRISWKSAVIMATKFTQVVISSKNSQKIEKDITTKSLNEKEIAGMQYLGGYVLRKVFYKLKEKIKSNENEQAKTLILSLRSVEDGDTFTDELSRDGALWKITDEVSKVFMITERYFCVHTAEKGLRNIPINNLVDNLISFPPLKLGFFDIASSNDVSIDDTVIINTLASIIRLYLRVRTFSLTKDIVTKLHQKQSTEKSLRKTIKLACINEETK